MERISRELVAGRSFATLLDAGCGSMPYRPLFAPHVADYLGCDLPGNADAQIHFDSRGGIPLPDSSVDAALSSQVLEHVPDPSSYLAELRRVLRAGGLLVLSTHGVWSYHPDPADYWRWTHEGLTKLIRDRGFDVLRVHGVVGPAATALQQLQDAVLRRLPQPFRALSTFSIQFLMQLADRCTSAQARERDAGTYVVVARKVA
jgi:SAM-dependent methyltransferase